MVRSGRLWLTNYMFLILYHNHVAAICKARPLEYVMRSLSECWCVTLRCTVEVSTRTKTITMRHAENLPFFNTTTNVFFTRPRCPHWAYLANAPHAGTSCALNLRPNPIAPYWTPVGANSPEFGTSWAKVAPKSAPVLPNSISAQGQQWLGQVGPLLSMESDRETTRKRRTLFSQN